MPTNLIVVESPAKAKTMSKYLGKEFTALASYGHVRDLVPKQGAVDTENDFAMKYGLIEKNEKHVDAIVKAMKKADALYLATDPDREGEAISWHLYEILKERGALDGKPVHRVEFYEITKSAIQQAIQQPRALSENLINAQQARRALDYLVGFNLSPPFTTSTLQQEAARKLGFSAQRTMRTAQQLYEGVDIGGENVGLISYMRTDAVNLANEAVAEIREVIRGRFGAENLPDEPQVYKSKSKNAQEAHEAIRPTSAARPPESLHDYLKPEQFRLYELIWRRTVACQMLPALLDTVAVDLEAGQGNVFRANGSHVVKPGFMAVYQEGSDDKPEEEDEAILPSLERGDAGELRALRKVQHFTEPPPRYSEASLVKTLEAYGIGRPSTYASIIATLESSEYVILDKRRFTPTDVGRVVNKFLSEHFHQYVDYEFTARMEDDLAAISRGEKV